MATFRTTHARPAQRPGRPASAGRAGGSGARRGAASGPTPGSAGPGGRAGAGRGRGRRRGGGGQWRGAVDSRWSPICPFARLPLRGAERRRVGFRHARVGRVGIGVGWVVAAGGAGAGGRHGDGPGQGRAPAAGPADGPRTGDRAARRRCDRTRWVAPWGQARPAGQAAQAQATEAQAEIWDAQALGAEATSQRSQGNRKYLPNEPGAKERVVVPDSLIIGSGGGRGGIGAVQH